MLSLIEKLNEFFNYQKELSYLYLPMTTENKAKTSNRFREFGVFL
ncbi:MAG: hypothetical protein CM15mP22_8190 [Gammaproteobacteria bacterium]|nr:MAG: hypothetical protein CM15mP22_8190 [Gammaproteobacteria bacterium]